MFNFLNLYPGYLRFIECFIKIMLSTNRTELSVKVSVTFHYVLNTIIRISLSPYC